MSWADGLTAVAGTIGLVVSLVFQAAWLYLAWRVVSWVLYERSGIERNPAQSLRFGVRRLVCRHRRGYARIRDGHGRNYLACSFCGVDVNKNRREEDRV